MKKRDVEFLKNMLACALGAVIGAFVALNVWPGLWWIGLVVGGLFGYLAGDFHEVVGAARLAGKKFFGFRPDFNRHVFPLLKLLTTTITGNMVLVLGIISAKSFVLVPMGLEELGSAQIGTIFIFIILMTIWLWFVLDRTGFGLEPMGKWWMDLWIVSPPALIFYWLPCMVVAVVKNFVPAMCKCAAFVWMVYVLIHSDWRLLRMLDAATGAAVGYFAGSIAAGALAAGICWLINSELVAKRWLRVVPASKK